MAKSRHTGTNEGPQGLVDVVRDDRGLSGSIPEVLGAVGIGVILLGGTVFGILAGLNFAHDSTAKSGLQSIATGQLAYQVEHDQFGTMEELTTGGSRYVDAIGDNFEINTSADGSSFCASVVSKSSSKPTFWVTSRDGQKILTSKPADALCDGVLTPPEPEVPVTPPDPVAIAAIDRSTTVGQLFTNNVAPREYREGASIAFNGGVCEGEEATVQATYNRVAPSNATTMDTQTMTLAESNRMELAGVPNGSRGTVSIAVSCESGSDTASQAFTQTLPATSLGGANYNAAGASLRAGQTGAVSQRLTIKAMSSLPLTAEVRGQMADGFTPAYQSAPVLSTNATTNFTNPFPGGVPEVSSHLYFVTISTGEIKSEPASFWIDYLT